MKKWSPSYSYSYQRPVNQQKPHYQMTKRQSQSNRKKIEHKTYFSNKGEKIMYFGLQEEKPNLQVYTSCAGYLYFDLDWRNNRILKTTRYFSKKKYYSGSFWFVTRTKPNLSSNTSVFCAGIYLPTFDFWIEKTIAYSNLQHIFQLKKKSWFG